jgi:hypothetical protein
VGRVVGSPPLPFTGSRPLIGTRQNGRKRRKETGTGAASWFFNARKKLAKARSIRERDDPGTGVVGERGKREDRNARKREDRRCSEAFLVGKMLAKLGRVRDAGDSRGRRCAQGQGKRKIEIIILWFASIVIAR